MKVWDLSGYSEKSNIQEAYLPKTSFPGQIVCEILARLCSDDSIQILLNLTWVKTFRPTVAVKIVGTFLCLLLLSMLVYTICRLNRNKRVENQKRKRSR